MVGVMGVVQGSVLGPALAEEGQWRVWSRRDTVDDQIWDSDASSEEVGSVFLG